MKTMLYRQIGGFMGGLSDTIEVESRNPEEVDLTFKYELTPKKAGDPAPVVEEEVDFFHFYDEDENRRQSNQSGNYYVRGHKYTIEEALNEIERLKEESVIDEYNYENGIEKTKKLAGNGFQYVIVQEPSEEKKKHFRVIEALEDDQTLEDIREQTKNRQL